MSGAEKAPVRWSMVTPSPARGAIAAVQVRGEAGELDALIAGLGAGELPPARVAVRVVAGVDQCVLARFDERTLMIFPHAGRAILEQIAAALEARGAVREVRPPSREVYPEARDEIEARMLEAIARAASPLAVDLLLDQARRWARVGEIGEVDATTAAVLARLIEPALVAAVGPPNVGKSSLLNALAGRSVSVVADEPGTTRDHVGATLDLGGLVVRWVDCPGFRPGEADELQRAAQGTAAAVVRRADLVLWCGDAGSGFLAADAVGGGGERLAVGLRADLGRAEGATVVVSAKTGEGIDDLVGSVRERLAPAAILADPRAWRFWDVGVSEQAHAKPRE